MAILNAAGKVIKAKGKLSSLFSALKRSGAGRLASRGKVIAKVKAKAAGAAIKGSAAGKFVQKHPKAFKRGGIAAGVAGVGGAGFAINRRRNRKKTRRR